MYLGQRQGSQPLLGPADSQLPPTVPIPTPAGILLLTAKPRPISFEDHRQERGQLAPRAPDKYFHLKAGPEGRGYNLPSTPHLRVCPRGQLPLQIHVAWSRQHPLRAHLSDSTRQLLLCGHIVWPHQPTVKEEIHTGVDVQRV